MLTSGIKVFVHHLVKKKLLTFINMLGMSVGLAIVLMLALYVQDEWAKDRQHPEAAQKYRIGTVINTGNEILDIDTAAAPAVELLRENFSEIVATTRYYQDRFFLSAGTENNDGFHEERIGFADPNIGEFFSFVWRQGEPESAWKERNSIVLTESLAQKYFPEGSALGKTVTINKSLVLTVTGVIRDPALDSHIQLNAIAPMDLLNSLRGADFFTSWFNLYCFSYIQLKPDATIDASWPAMATFIKDNMPEAAREIFDPDWKPLSSIHLQAALSPGAQRTRMDDVRLLFGLCIGILAIACINFVNLATARSADRQKEIAIRKVTGCGQGQIFVQYMVESVCLVSLALLLAVGITELSLPAINAFTGKQLSLGEAGNFWLVTLGIGLITAVLAGVYPAMYLSGFRPLQILRRRRAKRAGFFSLRNLLVTFQFAIAIVAITAGTVMSMQLRFAQQRELGFEKDQVLVIENQPGTQWEVFKQRVLNTTDVLNVSTALSRPFRSIASSIPVRYEGSELAVENLSQFMVDFDYFELFDVDILAGRTFSEVIAKDLLPVPTDETPHPAGTVILNAAMVRKLGWTPEAAIGKRFELQYGTGRDFELSVVTEVVGVVADMYVDSVQREVVPQFFYVPTNKSTLDFIFLKLNTVNPQAQRTQIDAIWQELYPDVPANMYMLDSKFDTMYQRDSRQTALIGLFAMLAVFLSCMGLIGLVTYAAEQRIKEIGIRKTVGAGVLQIILLFNTDFSKLALVANVIAWPVAYVALQRWLESFAYRIDLTPLVFIGSGLIVLCVTLVTVGSTAAKAASAKPVLALRYE